MASNFLQDLFSSLLVRTPSSGAFSDNRPIEALCVELHKATGENAIKRLGATILEKYRDLETDEKHAFFTFLARELDVDPAMIGELAERYKADRNASNLQALLRASEPPRQEVLRRLNHVPRATHELVEMRADLLKLIQDNEPLKCVDLDFAHLFSSWFNRGFLVEQRVSWDSPASVLAKIIQYEAVHAINDWDDLRRRIQPPDRRCFAFFHPAMPNEPLVFVEVALCKGTPNSIQALLTEDREPISADDADTAVFYSISNCQKGLRGISFGNSLIKQVATDLSRELPQLSTFVTLSPLPGFARWLRNDAAELSGDQIAELEAACDRLLETGDRMDIVPWSDTLKTFAARYLLHAKRGDGTPLDPVARFHLNNGATLHALHALADISAKGLEGSFGVMVNYHYDLKQVEAHHEDFSADGIIHASRTMRQLADANPPIITRRDTQVF